MTAMAFISDAMRDAAIPGDAAAPLEFFKLAAQYPDPIAALCDHDKANAIFEAIDQEFPFIRQTWITKTPLSTLDHAKFVSLLRWLVEALRVWKRVDDPYSVHLVSIFVVVQACDQDGQFWPLLPSDILNNAELFECVSKLISSFAVTYGTRGGVQAPIWEQEALDRLKQAESEGDWTAIGDAWRPFEAQLLPNVLQIQTMRCLNCLGVDHLAKAVENIRQTAVAMQLVAVLKVDDRFDLALASDNSFIQFACIYQTFSGRHAVQSLTSNAEQILAKVLVKIASDSPLWLGWLHVFNAYPQRHPVLQAGLGLALVSVSDAAREAYIGSITLFSTQVDSSAPGRECVAACLRVFRQNASDVQRVALWTLAYKRWRNWRFNQVDTDQHLLKINRCPLDYAIVGYACECLSLSELESEMASIRSELQTIEDRWHTSIADVITEWNRLLSMFQPLGHARLVKDNGEDWLTSNLEYWPFDFSNLENQYVLSKFGVEPKKPAPQP